jgi:hypothetical protein
MPEKERHTLAAELRDLETERSDLAQQLRDLDAADGDAEAVYMSAQILRRRIEMALLSARLALSAKE